MGHVVELTDDTKSIILDLTEKIITLISRKGDFRKKKVSTVTVTTDDGVDYDLPIYLSSLRDYKAYILDISDDETFQLELVVNPKLITGKKDLYNTLYHEFLHATDPLMTTDQGDEYLNDYDPDDEGKYYGSAIEARAIMGEFIQMLRFEVNDIASRGDQREVATLIKVLVNLKNFLHEKEELRSITRQFFDLSRVDFNLIDMEELRSKVNPHGKFAHLLHDFDDEELPERLLAVTLLRKNNKKAWEIFLHAADVEIGRLLDMLKDGN